MGGFTADFQKISLYAKGAKSALYFSKDFWKESDKGSTMEHLTLSQTSPFFYVSAV